jgi:hypothetical protein
MCHRQNLFSPIQKRMQKYLGRDIALIASLPECARGMASCLWVRGQSGPAMIMMMIMIIWKTWVVRIRLEMGRHREPQNQGSYSHNTTLMEIMALEGIHNCLMHGKRRLEKRGWRGRLKIRQGREEHVDKVRFRKRFLGGLV